MNETLNNIQDYTTNNEQIAFILGFRKSVSKESKLVQWSYPQKWERFIYSFPVTSIPDFEQVLNNSIGIFENFGLMPQERPYENRTENKL